MEVKLLDVLGDCLSFIYKRNEMGKVWYKESDAQDSRDENINFFTV